MKLNPSTEFKPIEFKLHRQGRIFINGKKGHQENLWLAGARVFPFYVDRTVKMLNWTYSSFIEDATQERKRMEQSSELEAYRFLDKDFVNRTLARIFLYINLVYVFEGFLRKAYADLLYVVRCCKAGELDSEAFIKKRQEELSVIIDQYRHKVVAHTSYANPRNDSFALQMGSLVIPSSLSYSGYDPVTLTLNGSGQFWGEDVGLDSFAISKEHEKMINHFKEWDLEFARLFGFLRDISPFSNNDLEITVAERGFSNVQF